MQAMQKPQNIQTQSLQRQKQSTSSMDELSSEMKSLVGTIKGDAPDAGLPRIRQQPVMQEQNIPHINELIGRVEELLESNQKATEEMIKANAQFKSMFENLPSKFDELITDIKELIDLIKTAGEEDISVPDRMKALTDQFQRLIEQNQKIVESNRALISSPAPSANRSVRVGTPISQVMSSYPKVIIRSLREQQ